MFRSAQNWIRTTVRQLRSRNRRRRFLFEAVPTESLESRQLLTTVTGSLSPEMRMNQELAQAPAGVSVQILKNGQSVSQVDLQDTFEIVVTAEDTRTDLSGRRGVFSAYATLSYSDPAQIDLVDHDDVEAGEGVDPRIKYGSDQQASGKVNELTGEIFEAGALNGDFSFQKEEFVLFRLKAVAKTPGEIEFKTHAAGDQFKQFVLADDFKNDFRDSVNYGTLTLTISDPNADLAPALVETTVAIVRERTGFDGGQTDALPQSIKIVDEWDSVYVEVWARAEDVDVSAERIQFDLTYDPALFQFSDVDFGQEFDLDRDWSADDATGRLNVRASASDSVSVTAAGQVLLARISVSVRGDADLLDQETGSYAPATAQFEVQDLTIVSDDGGEVNAVSNASAQTKVWPVIYDIDRDGRISFGDLTAFASVFGQDAATPAAKLADFDLSGEVSFADVAALARYFGQNRGSGGIRTYPNLPARPIADAVSLPLAPATVTPAVPAQLVAEDSTRVTPSEDLPLGQTAVTRQGELPVETTTASKEVAPQQPVLIQPVTAASDVTKTGKEIAALSADSKTDNASDGSADTGLIDDVFSQDMNPLSTESLSPRRR